MAAQATVSTTAVRLATAAVYEERMPSFRRRAGTRRSAA